MDTGMDRPDQVENEPLVPEKSKSSLRLRYESEVAYLIQQHGDLEQIRHKLGLSRRKICQVLLVDPSAWTRWTSPGAVAPPHIHKALDWYLTLLSTQPEYRHLATRFAGWINEEADIRGRLAFLERTLRTLGLQSRSQSKNWQFALTFGAGLVVGAVLIWLSRLVWR